MSSRLIGTVKWFNETKGYGFVTPDGGGKDYFVHHSDIKMGGFRVLREGQKVSFVPSNSDKGPLATDVKSEEE